MGEERSTKQASEGVAAGNISDEDWGRRPGVFNLRGIAALQPLQDIISGLPPGEIEFSSALPQHRDTTGISGVLELVGGRRAFPKFEEGFEMLERLWRWDDFWGNNTSGRNVSTSGVPDTTPQVLWLMDIVGDSFSRAHFRRVTFFLQGVRNAEPEGQGANKKSNRVFCCEQNPSSTCSVRLSYNSSGMLFDGTEISDQVAQQGGALGGGRVVCVTWQWSTHTSDSGMLRHLTNLLDATQTPVPPRALSLNQGLHCGFHREKLEECSEDAMRTVDEILSKLHFARQVTIAVDTAPRVIEGWKTSHWQTQGREGINKGVGKVNARTRGAYLGAGNRGERAHAWLRDIEELSTAFHARRGCVKPDGVHITCQLFHDLSSVMFLNLLFGNVALDPADPESLVPRRESERV